MLGLLADFVDGTRGVLSFTRLMLKADVHLWIAALPIGELLRELLFQ